MKLLSTLLKIANTNYINKMPIVQPNERLQVGVFHQISSSFKQIQFLTDNKPSIIPNSEENNGAYQNEIGQGEIKTPTTNDFFLGNGVEI